ncbi:DUF58 domain-containing protein [Hominenteromicrobium sp.]|uniref:DUF58 domain-containing protein n=1 Tax=Hominenteromicrobium sp. TaxID=3073581 RepID=UPI003A8F38EA
MELETQSTLLGTKKEGRFLLSLTSGQSNYTVKVPAEQCGELRFSCKRICVRDVLNLYNVQTAPVAPVRTVIYPRRMKVQLLLSQASAGTPQPEGKMRNRKGNDPSEMFDLREYVPGDDVRSIHWKLSGKTDTLILRQASDPSLYNIVLLMDFGIEKNGEPTPLEELNAAAAVAAAVGAQLVQQHITFSAAVPTRNGLEIYEVRTQKDFQQMLMHWMCFPLQQTEGAGMRYFLTQQMDRQYARLVLLTAGQYTASLKPLEGRIGTTVISAVSGGKLQHIAVGGGCEVVELPAERIEDEVYRILC